MRDSLFKFGFWGYNKLSAMDIAALAICWIPLANDAPKDNFYAL